MQRQVSNIQLQKTVISRPETVAEVYMDYTYRGTYSREHLTLLNKDLTLYNV